MQEVQKFLDTSGKEIILRPAESDDSCEIIDTIRSNSLERSYVLMDQYGKDVESEKKYIDELDRKMNLLLVAVAGNEVIGCLGALQADSGHRPQTAHILHVGLHIKDAYRGLGIGSRMLSYAIEWAREKGFKKLEASIFTTNKRSINLFSREGFCEEGVRKKRIRVGRDYIDEVLVGKILD